MRGTIGMFFLLASLTFKGQVPVSFVYGYTGEESFVLFEQIGDEYLFVGNTSSNESGLSDVFVLRTNDSFTPVSLKIQEYFHAEEAVDAVLHSGYLYILINRLSLDSGYDPVLVKTDLEGNMLCQVNFGGDEWEFGKRIKIADDGIKVVGSWPDGQSSDSNVFVALFDFDCQLLTLETFGSSFSAIGNDIDSYENGLMVVGSIEVLENGIPKRKPSLFQLNNMLQFVGLTLIGGQFGEINFVKSSDLGLVIGGQATIDGAGENFFIGLLDQSLQEEWLVTLAVQGCVVDARVESDRLVFLANTASYSFNGNDDTFLFQTNFEGTFAGSRLYGGSEVDQCFHLFSDSQGNSVLCGKTKSFTGPDNQAYAVFIPSMEPGTSFDNLGEVVVFNDSSLDVSTEIQSSISAQVIYPNPCFGSEIFFATPVLSISILDLTGNAVSHNPTSNCRSMNMSGMNSGMYTIVGKNENGSSFVEKLVVIRP